MQRKHINLVDFDQVLFNTREALLRVYMEAFHVNGIHINATDLLDNEGESIDKLFNAYNLDERVRTGIKNYKKLNYHRFFKYIIPNYDLIGLPNKVIISNARSQDIEKILSYYSITGVLGIIGRDKVENIKPHPDPYIKGFTSFAAETYTVYEDSEIGIMAATAAVNNLGKENFVKIVRVELNTVKLKGGSGQLIRKQSDYIDKITTSNNALITLNEYDVCTPEIFFYNSEKIIMSYIDGVPLSDIYNHNQHFGQILDLINDIKKIPKINSSNVQSYIERLEFHKKEFLDDNELVNAFNFCIANISGYRNVLEKEKTFSHGDFTLSNIIYQNDKFIVIDPNYHEQLFSSWLLDLSKLLQSARGYELIFGITKKDLMQELEHMRNGIFEYVGSNLVEVLEVLELSHWLRMLKYKKYNSHEDFIKARAISIGIVKELRKCQIQQLS